MSGFDLVFGDGPLAGHRFRVEDELVVGRVGTTLEVPDPEVSRRHAAFRVSGNALEVEDLKSLNGTFVNGRRVVGPIQLGHGDVVRIGDTTLDVQAERETGTVVAEAEQAAPPAAPPPAAPAALPTEPFAPPQARVRRSAPATRMREATFLSLAFIVATMASLIVYFALR